MKRKHVLSILLILVILLVGAGSAIALDVRKSTVVYSFSG